ncbi:uncharacterized protein BP5553_05240 [Venustampulla echinocandica]|uniref:Protein prenylyltransferase n=1 Tax=Venustampulla echinocandica TaxID=2656787 RepID=A0A370TQK9_9HELO|nr:uncharacterized protein BP5553_05240 [Venustampulla echinocandica]RDL37807.1 hypothetical protein BP5553_05240 [Venustampulla echinocandica]
MSRALDRETVASLQSNDTHIVYNDIVRGLCQERTQLLEIELLGKSHPIPAGQNFLLEENSIAIPKVKLVQAFVVARQIFFELLKKPLYEKRDELRNATAVMLLMDPENLTAANARKRLIESCREGSKEEVQLALERELLFVDSYLTARLHRHTKSPTLWSHRRWILQICHSVQLEYDIQRDLRTVVLIAAERHPRNYYAWSHMRWLVQTFGVKDAERNEMLLIVNDWCLRHPGDTSGFSFLLFFLASFGCPEDPSRIEASTRVFRDVLDLATSFKWTHESVWVFLRTLAASGEVTEAQTISFSRKADAILAAHPDNPQVGLTFKAAIAWFEKYQRRPYT